jgi:DNA polymerase III, gamma/tau subunits
VTTEAWFERYGRPPPPRANWLCLGHEAAERDLHRLACADRLPHAWLFHGPAGIGKATLAFRLARFVLAQDAVGVPPASVSLFGETSPPPLEGGPLAVDPDQPVYRRAAGGGHADLLTIERGMDEKRGRMRREVVVDDVRRIIPFLTSTPAESRWRVVVVDGADEMNSNAANALLKILEEPPAFSLLLLVSDSPAALPATVRSRCRRLALRPLTDDAVVHLLGLYRPDLAADDACALAGLASGSIGRALALAEADGIKLWAETRALLAALPVLDAKALFAFAERVGKAGNEALFWEVAEMVRGFLGQLLRAAATGGGDAADPQLQRLAAAASLDRWLQVWDKIEDLFARTDTAYLDRKQVLLAVFFALKSGAAGG